jgi:hypothetical protein
MLSSQRACTAGAASKHPLRGRGVASFSFVLAGLRSAPCCSRRGALGAGRGDKEGGWGERGLLLLLLASSFSLLLLLVIAFTAENKAQHMHVCARCVGQVKTPPLLAGAWLLLAASGVERGHGRGGPLSPLSYFWSVLFLRQCCCFWRCCFCSLLIGVFVQCWSCPSCSAFALLVAAASRARCALGAILPLLFAALPLRIVLSAP